MPDRHHTDRRRLRLPPARSLALVAVGGALGALARFAVGVTLGASAGAWPWSTLAVNVSGAFLLAVLVGLVTARFDGGAWTRPLLGTGMLGAYTTFSAVSVEIERLAARGAGSVALAYATTTLAAGIASAWAGVVVAAALLRLRRSRHPR